MDKDREAFDAWLIAYGAATDTFEWTLAHDAWQAALAYAREERGSLRRATQRLIDAADGMAYSTNSSAADDAIEEARSAFNVSPHGKD